MPREDTGSHINQPMGMGQALGARLRLVKAAKY